MRHCYRGVLFAALAQVLAVGVDEGGPVFRCPDEAVGFGDTRVAFDGVQRQVEPAAALEQPDAFVGQGVDLLPAFAGRCGLRSVAWWRAGFGPAKTVRGDFFAGGFGEVVPQVPAVGDLDCVGQSAADRFGVAGRGVPADDLDAGMLTQPFLEVSALRSERTSTR